MTGNPANMAFCIACFVRDIAGSLRLHTAAPVQYFRPEIAGIIAGATIVSLATHEYKSTAGSAPIIRLFLGFTMAVGALIFLGCPLRMVIRMAAGDLNAYVALIGFAAGVTVGTLALKNGFTLGRAYETQKANGLFFPIVMVVLFVLSITTTVFSISEKGPGSMHAPALLALAVGAIIGGLSQKTRTCFAGSIRDIILVGSFDLFAIIAGLFVTLLVCNAATGHLHFSFAGQPIAHSQHLWSILGMFAVGMAAVLAGGCPFRQLVLAGQGSADSAITVIGMVLGAAAAHNFGWAGAAASATSKGGTSPAGKAVLITLIVVTLIIAFTQKRTAKK
ncbi:MAG: YedE-related selenium metabolism membrane protein [Treponema sp.]|nr:YedE-related selenium metabolism membrane protein [Treponema sp.]